MVDDLARPANTNAQMIFHRLLLQAMTGITPQADVLPGKPMPVAAVTGFYAGHAGAASPTSRYQAGDALLSGVSVSSCLMNPTRYDLPVLEDFEPSCYIASSLLKRLTGVRLPALDWVEPAITASASCPIRRGAVAGWCPGAGARQDKGRSLAVLLAGAS